MKNAKMNHTEHLENPSVLEYSQRSSLTIYFISTANCLGYSSFPVFGRTVVMEASSADSGLHLQSEDHISDHPPSDTAHGQSWSRANELGPIHTG